MNRESSWSSSIVVDGLRPPDTSSQTGREETVLFDTQSKGERFHGDALILSAIVLVFIVLGIAYSFINPLFESSDEDLHFAFAKYIADRGELPVQPPSQNGHQAGQEASQPPIYYLVGSLGLRFVNTTDFDSLLQANPHWAYDTMNRHNDNKNRLLHLPEQNFSLTGTALAVHLLRWLSVLFGVLTILCTYGIAKETFPKRRDLAIASAALIAFTPQFIFVNSSVTNDSAASALTSLFLLLLVRGLRVGFGKRNSVALGLSLGLALLSKLSALALVPLTALVFGMLILWGIYRSVHSKEKQGLENAKSNIKSLALCLSIAAFLAGWWYIRNWSLYGEPTGSQMMLDVFGHRVPTPGLLDLFPEFTRVQQTFWAAFGWSNVLVDEPIYIALNVLTGLALVGLFLALIKKGRPLFHCLWNHDWDDQNLASALRLAILALWYLLVLASFLNWMQNVTAPYGRLLFPAIPAIAIFLLYGLGQLRPARRRKYVYGFLTVAFLLFAIISPFRYIAPAYAEPPTFEPANQPVISHKSSLIFGDMIELLGYDLTVENQNPNVISTLEGAQLVSAKPGEVLKVTLYWLPLSQVPSNYTVFIHLSDSALRPLGQRDTYPGLGNYPTSFWKVGTGIRDVYYVPINSDADVPVLASLQIGLYDERTMQRLPVRDENSLTDSGPQIAKLKIVLDNQSRLPSTKLDAQFGNGIVLEGYDVSAGNDQTVQSGSAARDLSVTLYWRALQQPTKDYTVFAQILDSKGRIVSQHDSMPRHGDYPTSAWSPNEQVMDEHTIVIPTDLTGDSNQLIIGFYDQKTGERIDVLGQPNQFVPINLPVLILGKGDGS